MADDHPIPQYPFMFSPDQWSNKFSPLAGQPIPWPSQYQGTPTDAMGRPIQSYLDAQSQAAAAQAPPVTLNTNPAANNYGMDPQVYKALQQQGIQPSQMPGAGIGAQIAAGQGMPTGFQALYGRNFAAFQPPQPQALAQAAQPAALAGPDMSQAYLNALSNPGKVTTPGATVPQSPPPSNQSGVLQNFLTNWNQGGQKTQGAGNYNNAGFFNALKGQV